MYGPCDWEIRFVPSSFWFHAMCASRQGEAGWAHVDFYSLSLGLLGARIHVWSQPLGANLLCTGVWVLSRFGLYVKLFALVYMPCTWVLQGSCQLQLSFAWVL